MSGNDFKYLYSFSKNTLVAANSQGITILFRQSNNDWIIAPRTYNQIMGDCIYNGDDFDSITHEKAKNIYKDISPDIYFENIEMKYSNKK